MPTYVLRCPECGRASDVMLSYDSLIEGLDNGTFVCDNDGVPLKRVFSAEGCPQPLYHPSHSLRVKQRMYSERWDAAVADGVRRGFSDD